MSEFTSDEIEGIVKAMSQKKLSEEEKSKVPLRPAGSYRKIATVTFSPFLENLPARSPHSAVKNKLSSRTYKPKSRLFLAPPPLLSKNWPALKKAPFCLLKSCVMT